MKGTLDQHKAELYAIGALTTFAIWPWTIFVMMPTNEKLIKQHEAGVAGGWNNEVAQTGTPKEETPHGLIQKWSNLNIIRGCMPLVAAVLGLWVTVN